MKHSKKIILLASLFALMSGCGSSTSSGDPNNDTNTNPEAPVLGAIGNKIVALGDLLTFTVSATDPNNLNLTYATDGSPENNPRPNPYTETGNLASFNTNTRQFSWNTTGVATGDYTVEFSVMNSAALSDSETIHIWIQTDPVQFEAGQTLYNNNCRGSGCHRNEDDNLTAGVEFGVLCTIESAINSATESGPGNMPVIILTSTEEAAIAYYLANVRPDDC